MPLTASDIYAMQRKSLRSGPIRGYYGFRRAIGVTREMRNITRRLDELEGNDSDIFRQLDEVFSLIADIEGVAGGFMNYMSMGVAASALYAVNPALAGVALIAGGIQRGLQGGNYAIETATKSAYKYGAVKHPHGYAVFTGPGGGRKQWIKWFNTEGWRSQLALFGIVV